MISGSINHQSLYFGRNDLWMTHLLFYFETITLDGSLKVGLVGNVLNGW
jgi:hypothetical protein